MNNQHPTSRKGTVPLRQYPLESPPALSGNVQHQPLQTYSHVKSRSFMKYKLLFLLLTSALFARQSANGQTITVNCTTPPPCIQNPVINAASWSSYHITTYPGKLINQFGYDIDGWEVTAGSPKYGDGNAGSVGIELASGQAVKTCYDFRAGTTYLLCFVGFKPAGSGTTGNLIFEAKNAMGSPLLLWNTSSTFTNFNPVGYQSYQQTITVPPGTNYKEMQIYTTGASGTYSVVLDDIQITEVPVLTATQTTINACQSTVLSATSKANNLDVTWSPSSTLSSSIGATVTAKPCGSTQYVATYKSQCSFSCANSSLPISITVNPMVANATVSPSTITPCSAGATLTATASVSPYTVSWLPGTGINNPNIATVTAKPCNSQIYTANIVCTGSNCSTSRSVTVNVNTSGNTVTASPSTITGCQTSTLTANSTNTMNVFWRPNYNLTPIPPNQATVRPCSTHTYYADFTCPSTGCTYTTPVTVNVQPSGSIINNSASIPCNTPISMSFSGNNCATNSYLWTGPQGNTLSTGPSFNMTNTSSRDQGTYTLRVISQGCTTTHTAVVVMTNCCSVNADFQIQGCNPIRLVNTTTVGPTYTPVIQGEWYWDFDDGNVSTIRNPSHRYSQSLAPRNICLTVVSLDADGISTCCDKVCKELTPCGYATACEPRAAFGYTITNPVTNSVQLLDKSVGAGTACAWVWKVGTTTIPGTTNANPIVTMAPGLPHTVCLRVTYCLNGGTCEEEWCEQVIIQ